MPFLNPQIKMLFFVHIIHVVCTYGIQNEQAPSWFRDIDWINNYNLIMQSISTHIYLWIIFILVFSFAMEVDT